jgi:hypothetical protein
MSARIPTASETREIIHMFAAGNSPVQIVQALGLPVNTALAVIECARQKKLWLPAVVFW